MAKQSLSPGHLNREKTRTALHQAIDEVHHAARPGRLSLPRMVSWAVALAAGATVAWRSWQAGRQPDNQTFGQPPPGFDKAEFKSGAGLISESTKERQRRSDRSRKQKSSEAKEGDYRPEDCPARAKSFGELSKELWCRIQTDEIMTRAQALAFIGVLSLGPVLLFGLAALGFVIHDPVEVEGYVHQLVGHLLPGRQASEAANSLIAQTHIIESARTLMKGKWWAVSIGVVSLLWAAIGLIIGASDPMNRAWDVKETRNFATLRLVALGVFFGAGALFLASLIPSSLPSLIGHFNIPFIGALSPEDWWIGVLGWVLAVVVDIAMFTVIFRFLPNAKVTWKSALFGGAIVGFLWELFKQGFALYVAHFGNYNKLYGALGGAVLLVTWIWYSCIVLLVGPILCKMYNEHTEEGGVVQKGRPVKEH